MSETTFQRFKWFWAWADDQEELWLRQMAHQGYHLLAVAPFGIYTFSKGKMQDVVYRLDFLSSVRNKDDYFHLFQDAGWEHVGQMAGWQYWCKLIQEGEEAQIFTDAESKIEKYRRLIRFLSVTILILLMNLILYIADFTRYKSFGIHALYALIFLVLVLNIYGLFQLQHRVNSLKRL